jgi:hypothetical protein
MIKFAAGVLLLSSTIWIPAMAAGFSYEIQRAGYAFDQSDKMGAIDSVKFIETFRHFPWKEQVGKANGGAEATISVNNLSAGTTLFVSVAGEKSDYAYIVGIVYMKPQDPFLGVISRKPVKWVDMFVTDDPRVVERVFDIYFSSTLEKTRSGLAQLDKFDSVPAAH